MGEFVNSEQRKNMTKKIVLALALLFVLSIARPLQAQTPPCPTGKTCSGGVTFTVSFPNPTSPASVAPSSVVAGAAATTVTLTAASGSSFNAQMVVEACAVTPTPCTTQTDLATTFVSATSITAVVPVALLANSGTISLYISQPANAHASNLSWTPSTSVVAGYNVYRGAVSGGPIRSSTPQLLAA
jgi:hypothetical protein